MALSHRSPSRNGTPLSDTESCPFPPSSERVFTGCLGLEVRVKVATLALKRVLFPRGLCFSVVGGRGGRAVLTAANSPSPSEAWLPVSGGAVGAASFGLSHMKEALGQEAGLQFRNRKNLGGGGGTGGRGESAHTEGPESHCQRGPSPPPPPSGRFGPAGGAPDPHSFTVHPPPLR